MSESCLTAPSTVNTGCSQLAGAKAHSSELSRTGRLIAMGQMAATLAHEIRNPLGSMELYCSLLKKDLAKDSEQLALAEHIHQGIRTLDRVITNCLQFSRDIEPRFESILDISKFLNDCIRSVEPSAVENDVKIRCEVVAAESVTIDPYLATQAIVNVLHNAIDAVSTQENSDRRVVEIESNIDDERGWQLVVRDRGCGIALEDQERIFDPFFTTKQKGTGLGLAVVNSILAAHRGEVLVKSAADQGTAVILNWGRRSLDSWSRK